MEGRGALGGVWIGDTDSHPPVHSTWRASSWLGEWAVTLGTGQGDRAVTRRPTALGRGGEGAGYRKSRLLPEKGAPPVLWCP